MQFLKVPLLKEFRINDHVLDFYYYNVVCKLPIVSAPVHHSIMSCNQYGEKYQKLNRARPSLRGVRLRPFYYSIKNIFCTYIVYSMSYGGSGGEAPQKLFLSIFFIEVGALRSDPAPKKKRCKLLLANIFVLQLCDR